MRGPFTGLPLAAVLTASLGLLNAACAFAVAVPAVPPAAQGVESLAPPSPASDPASQGSPVPQPLPALLSTSQGGPAVPLQSRSAGSPPADLSPTTPEALLAIVSHAAPALPGAPLPRVLPVSVSDAEPSMHEHYGASLQSSAPADERPPASAPRPPLIEVPSPSAAQAEPASLLAVLPVVAVASPVVADVSPETAEASPTPALPASAQATLASRAPTSLPTPGSEVPASNPLDETDPSQVFPHVSLFFDAPSRPFYTVGETLSIILVNSSETASLLRHPTLGRALVCLVMVGSLPQAAGKNKTPIGIYSLEDILNQPGGFSQAAHRAIRYTVPDDKHLYPDARFYFRADVSWMGLNSACRDDSNPSWFSLPFGIKRREWEGKGWDWS